MLLSFGCPALGWTITGRPVTFLYRSIACRARQAMERYRKVTGLPVMVQPNAGQPKLSNMQVIYDETPDQMVQGVAPLLGAGVNILGACCGSTPEHIRAFRKAMDQYLGTNGWQWSARKYENQTL